MNNKVLITIVSVLFIFGFLALAYKLTNKPKVIYFPGTNLVREDDHIKWSQDSKNILVEYSDLQCLACKNFHILIKNQIESTSPGQIDITKKVTFVYRHFPLYQINRFAQDAARAAEAAGKQGKFFEFADILFEEQEIWSKKSIPNDDFLKYGKRLNLNIEKFKTDLSSKEGQNKIEKDVDSGLEASVNATPAFYLNGNKLDSIRSFDEFKQLLSDL